MRVRWLTTALLAALFAAGLGSTQEAPKAVGRTLVGELVRVDLGRRSLTLHVGGKPPREYELMVDDATRFVSQGRALTFDQLRIGERAVAVVVEDGRGGRRLSLLKLGAAAYAAPGPSASPTPPS